MEVGLSVEDEQENSIENINENYIQNGVVGEETNENAVEDDLNQDGVADEESNANAVEDENFGFINDNERGAGIDEDEGEYEPLDTELLPIMERLNEISVDQLEGDESNKLNLNRVYFDVQLLRLITSSLQLKAMTYGVRCHNNKNQKIIFSRLMLCRVYLRNNHYIGSRLIYLMEPKNSN